jgi:hypothetical protein
MNHSQNQPADLCHLQRQQSFLLVPAENAPGQALKRSNSCGDAVPGVNFEGSPVASTSCTRTWSFIEFAIRDWRIRNRVLLTGRLGTNPTARQDSCCPQTGGPGRVSPTLPRPWPNRLRRSGRKRQGRCRPAGQQRTGPGPGRWQPGRFLRDASAEMMCDSHLSGLREPRSLVTMSLEEREECLALWQEVAVLLNHVQMTKCRQS